jgi:hypothetical protein
MDFVGVAGIDPTGVLLQIRRLDSLIPRNIFSKVECIGKAYPGQPRVKI